MNVFQSPDDPSALALDQKMLFAAASDSRCCGNSKVARRCHFHALMFAELKAQLLLQIGRQQV